MSLRGLAGACAILLAALAATSCGTTGLAESGAGDTGAGKELFKAKCAACHTLADAGTAGAIGPNLDDAKPPKALVGDRVTNGQGVMPSFKDSLDPQQIEAVAEYVSSAAGR